MKRALASLLIWRSLTVQVHAGEVDSLVGTMSVNFQPITSEGVTDGCSLVFNTVAVDYAYRQGKPVLGVGNFSVMGTKQNFGMSLKLGVANVFDRPPKAEAPHYAYIKTTNGTTAGAKFESIDSDMDGFKMFVYQVNEKTLAVISDLIDGQNATIGFNRSKGGMDVLMPLDLTVVDAVQSSDGSIKQIHSQDALQGFRQCFIEVTSSLQ